MDGFTRIVFVIIVVYSSVICFDLIAEERNISVFDVISHNHLEVFINILNPFPSWRLGYNIFA
jgi:hypothetical protein